MSNLRKNAVNGVLWTTIRTGIVSLTGPLLLIVQARFLTPREFGVLAIINIFITVINVIENFGLSTAIVQKDHVSKDERSSLFFLQLAFSILIGLIIIVLAPIFSNIFDMSSLISLLPLLSIVVFLIGPVKLFTAFFEKDFYFKELSIIQIIREITLLIATSILLFVGMGLRGIVYGQIAAAAVMAILTTLVAYNKDLIHIGFHFKYTEVRPFVKFGLYIAGKQLMTQITHHIDELVIGYFMSQEVLGLYYFAKNLLNRLRALITTSFSKVLLPLLSKVKNNLERLTHAYNLISEIVGIVSFPIFVGTAITAHIFIPLIFGNEWLESVPFFVMLSVAYIPYILTANIATSLLYSINKPGLVLYTDVVINILYMLLLLLVSWAGLGIYAVVGLYVIYLVSKAIVLQILTQKHLHSTFKSYMKLFKYPLIGVLIMSITVLLFQQLHMFFDSGWTGMVSSILIGIAAYLLAYYLLDPGSLIKIKENIVKKGN